MSQQDITQYRGLGLMALSLLRAVKLARKLLLPGGERIKRCNMVMSSGLGGAIDIELPATDVIEMAVDRIRLVCIESGDEFDGTLVIVLYGQIFSPNQRACLMLSSPADVTAFRQVLIAAGTEDFHPTVSLVGRVAPQACLCDTPEMQGGFHQLMFTDAGDFMASVSEPCGPTSADN